MKPWVETPEWQKEQEIIQRALIFQPFCKPCELLGWKKNCPGEEYCGRYLYSKLQEHFLEVENLRKEISSVKNSLGERYGKY